MSDDPRAADDMSGDAVAPSAARARPHGWAPPALRELPPPTPTTPAGSTPSTGSPGPIIRSQPDETWWRRRAAGLPVGAWLVVGAVAIGGIVTGALTLAGGEGAPKLAVDMTTLSVPVSTDSAPDASTPDLGSAGTPGYTVDSAPGAAAVTAPSSSSTVASVPPGSPPARPGVGDGSSPTAPLPVGDPTASRFEYAGPFGSAWSGMIAGLVEVPPLWEDESAGTRCFAVIGTLRPEVVEGVVSDAWSTPYLTLFVDGEEAELSVTSCATDELAAAGYRSMFDANVTRGTDFAFYAEFSVPESAGDPQAVAISQDGDADADETRDGAEWLFFDARLLDAVDPAEIGAVGPLPVEPAPIGDGDPGAFVHADDYTGDGWSGSILGVVEVPTEDGGMPGGRCFAVVGTLTAEAAGSGVVTSPYAAPPIALIADGRLIDDYYGCSNAEAEAAGYRWFNDAEITPGTSVAVYATLVVPQPLPGHLQAIVVGDPWSDAPAVLAPHALDDFAPAAVSPGPPPGGELTRPATRFTVAQEVDAANWEAVVHGHVATAPGASERAAECVVVLASFTLSLGASEPLPPNVFLVAGGRLLPEDLECDTEQARAAGYVEQWSQHGRVGGSIHVYAGFRIPPELGPPQAVVVGRGGLGDQVVVAPAALDAIPPIRG